MFLKLHEIEDPEKKAFILETLRIDVAIEARKVFKKFNKFGSPVEIVGTPNEESKLPILCKLVGIHNALVANTSWICPENLFDENSVPMHDSKGYAKPQLDSIRSFIPIVDPDPPFIIT
jgi:hypothetical protein